METTLKVLLVLCLSASFVMADGGDMGGGGLASGTTTNHSAKTAATANIDGDMGGGGLWTGSTDTKVPVNSENDGDMGGGGKTCPAGQTCLVNDSSSFWASFLSYLGF